MTLQISEPRTKRWTREEYYQLAEAGYFQGLRVQLIRGEILQMAPHGHKHATAIMLIQRWLHNVIPSSYLIRTQLPLNALEDSDPEPDIAVVPGPTGQYADHPTSAILVIEASDTSLRLDRRKASLYAAAGVQECWIVNIEGRCIEQHREPVADASAEFGSRYERSSIAKETDLISPLSMPSANVKVSELLP